MEKFLKNYKGFLNTPSIMPSDFFGIPNFDLPCEFDIDSSQIDCSEKSNLGKRAECFFKLAIENSKQWRLLASNLQVIHRKKTWGEFDFFVESKATPNKYHVELAYKFYLYDPEIKADNNRWIGPNRRDSLWQKAEKLKTRQLPLLFSDKASEILAANNLNPETFTQAVCLKAKLFVPKSCSKKRFKHINQDCIVGYWLHWEEFDHSGNHRHSFFSPKKTDWFAGPKSNAAWKSFSEIKTDIQGLFKRNKSALVYMKKEDGEFEQFFVVWW